MPLTPVEPVTRRCSTCEEVKPLGEFSPSELRGRHSRCRGCRAAEKRLERAGWSAERRARESDAAWERRLARIGLTPEDYAALAVSQGGVCAVSGLGPDRGRRLVVDHDHGTGAVRGLLRDEVNLALGLLRDDPSWAVSVAAYLLRSRGRRVEAWVCRRVAAWLR